MCQYLFTDALTWNIVTLENKHVYAKLYSHIPLILHKCKKNKLSACQYYGTAALLELLQILKKKLDENYTRMLYAILVKSWR